jgi:hypothetical protein
MPWFWGSIGETGLGLFQLTKEQVCRSLAVNIHVHIWHFVPGDTSQWHQQGDFSIAGFSLSGTQSFYAQFTKGLGDVE